VIPPAFLFSLRAAFAIHNISGFQMNFCIAFSISGKNDIGILRGIASYLWIVFGSVALFTILILLIHEHERSFFTYSNVLFNYFLHCLIIFIAEIFCLLKFIPRHFLSASVNGIFFLIPF
jgi:hypothetical protein